MFNTHACTVGLPLKITILLPDFQLASQLQTFLPAKLFILLGMPFLLRGKLGLRFFIYSQFYSTFWPSKVEDIVRLGIFAIWFCHLALFILNLIKKIGYG